MNIVVIAYMLHYGKGSEYAVAWDYIKHLSLRHHLTVIYGTSGQHHQIGNTEEMENYLAENPLENVDFISVKPSFDVKWFDYSLSGIRGFYKEYRKWHNDVFRAVSVLMSKTKVDVIHFLGPIGYHEPGILYTLPVPYIWGPVGGAEKFPERLLIEYGIKHRVLVGVIKIIAKNWSSRVRLATNKRVKQAMRESDVVVGATSQNVKSIKNAIGKHHCIIEYLPETCINEVFELDYQKFDSPRINLIYVANLTPGKAPMIVLDALSKLGDEREKLHVDFFGDGIMMGKCKRLIKKYNLEDVVTMHGKVKRQEVFHRLSSAHMMVLPTLKDANTTVVFEAMSHAVPTLCLDHCGMHDTIKDGSGVKIPISSYSNVVNEMANQLQRIANNPSLLKEMAIQLLEDRKAYTWERRMDIFEEFYKKAIKQYDKRQ